MSLVITPSTGSAVTFTDPTTAGFTGTAGRYWLKRGRADIAQYGKEFVKNPSTDGMQVKRHGFNSRDISNIEVVYVAASAAAVIVLFEADQAALAPLSCTVAMPDYATTFLACEVTRFEEKIYPDGRIIKPTSQGGTYRMHAFLGFKQVRLT